MNSHEYLFWCGDFNYRVDMDKEELKELIKAGDYESVLKCDQLRVSTTLCLNYSSSLIYVVIFTILFHSIFSFPLS